jgi:hypothetical protein
MSLAGKAQTYDPLGCSLHKTIAEGYWKQSSFYDAAGIRHMAYKVSLRNGILSVTFADGSILCPSHWQA